MNVFSDGKISVIIKQTYTKPFVEKIPNSDNEFQRITKGNSTKIIPFSNNRVSVNNVFCIVNAEGEELNLAPNFFIGNNAVFGNAVFVAKDYLGNIKGLTDAQITQIIKVYDSRNLTKRRS